VPRPSGIAVFDNDGPSVGGKADYAQLAFAIDRCPPPAAGSGRNSAANPWLPLPPRQRQAALRWDEG